MDREEVVVSVVAHRIRGTRVTSEPFTPRRRPFPFDYGDPAATLPKARTFGVDTEHGTRRSTEEIEALFTESTELSYTGGLTVNSLTRPHIVFRLREIIDHMVVNHLADFKPEGVSFNQFNRLGAINIYFVRKLEGARGRADPAGDSMYVGNQYDDERGIARAERWQRDVIVTSHELGHVLGLVHVPHPENVMFGYGTELTSDTFELPQKRIMQDAAARYGGFGLEEPVVVSVVADWIRDAPFDFTIPAGIRSES